MSSFFIRANSYYLPLVVIMLLTCCEKTEEVPFLLKSVVTDHGDILGTDKEIGIQPPTEFTATFSTELDPATGNKNNISLISTYNNYDVEISLLPEGKTIRIQVNEPLDSGTIYSLTFWESLRSISGELLKTKVDRTFLTTGYFEAKDAFAHWNFEGNANDVIGSLDADPSEVLNISWVPSRNTRAGKAAYFNGTTSYIAIPVNDQLFDTDEFSFCFWLQTSDVNKQCNCCSEYLHDCGFDIGDPCHSVIGSPGASMYFTVHYDYFNNRELIHMAHKDIIFNNSPSEGGFDFISHIHHFKDGWGFLVQTIDFNHRKEILYLNGGEVERADLEGEGIYPFDELIIGFINPREEPSIPDDLCAPCSVFSNPWADHLGGYIDDLRIFHRTLSPKEIKLMYLSEK